MKVRGDNAPSNAFYMEEQPNKPGYALVRFFENVKPFEETRDNLTIKGYEYDEYQLELQMYDGLAEDIVNSFDGYFAQAKLLEAEQRIIPNLEQKVSDLEAEKAAMEADITNTQIALCDVYELIAGGGM